MSRARVGPFLPLRGSGQFGDFKWHFHGLVDENSIYTYVSIEDDTRNSHGGGGVASRQFQTASGKGTSGAFQSVGTLQSGAYFGSSDRSSPCMKYGAVSKDVREVILSFENTHHSSAILLDSNDPLVRFFLVAYPCSSQSSSLVALDQGGVELDRTEPSTEA